MIIGAAGPYSAPTGAERAGNAAAMNRTAAALPGMGHIPLVGVNAALPVADYIGDMAARYEAIMKIYLAVIDTCEGLLLAESPAANRERDLVLSGGAARVL